MKDALIKAHNSFSDAVRADERAKIAKEAAKLLQRSAALVKAAEQLANELERFALRKETDPVVAMTNGKSAVRTVIATRGVFLPATRKPPSKKLTPDECATLVCAHLTPHTPLTMEQIAEVAKAGRSQVQRGLKVLMEQRRVVISNPDAQRGRKYVFADESKDSTT